MISSGEAFPDDPQPYEAASIIGSIAVNTYDELRFKMLDLRVEHQAKLEEEGTAQRIRRYLSHVENRTEQMAADFQAFLGNEQPDRGDPVLPDAFNHLLFRPRYVGHTNKQGSVIKRLLLDVYDPSALTPQNTPKRTLMMQVGYERDGMIESSGMFSFVDAFCVAECAEEAAALQAKIISHRPIAEPLPTCEAWHGENARTSEQLAEQRNRLAFMQGIQAAQLESSGTADKARAMVRAERANDSADAKLDLADWPGSPVTIKVLLDKVKMSNGTVMEVPVVSFWPPTRSGTPDRYYSAPLYDYLETGQRVLRGDYSAHDAAQLHAIVDSMHSLQARRELNLSDDLGRIRP